MTPIRAPDKIRRKRIRSGSSQAGVRLSWISPSFPVLHLCSDNLRIIRKRPRNKAPRIPLEKASSPEERGIYLLKRPIVPKQSSRRSAWMMPASAAPQGGWSLHSSYQIPLIPFPLISAFIPVNELQRNDRDCCKHQCKENKHSPGDQNIVRGTRVHIILIIFCRPQQEILYASLLLCLFD